MSVKERISSVVDKWFLYEPLLFNVYCTHKLEPNSDMKCSFRTGKRRIEYNPELLKDSSTEEIAQGLKNEVTRILLKHPYQRVPQSPNRSALTTASDVTISEHCYRDKNLKDANYYDFENGLSYEEYYKKLYYICPDFEAMNNEENEGQGKMHLSPDLGDGETWDYEAAADASEMWDEDEEMSDKVNLQIQKAQKTNQWGSVSGQFQETITASLKIPMDYRRILSQFRASIISQRRKLTRMKPNRRYGFEFMGSQFEPKTHLLVAVDVSGSIGSDDLVHFFSIINRFFTYGVEAINVIAFDTEIKQEFELKKAAKNIRITGRGGTDFQCAIDYYENHPEFQGMIIFTDGYADVPKITKAKQTLWILTSKNEYDYAIKWIKDLRMSKATWIPKVGQNA
ncbi:Predicted metal-dependent peptidase [Treponema bryantii]|uniref:Predicted metal-dependent peptidase n=1 Tax=Treponema bryantii TaxID=163 RepID=A0A1I3LK21_9SPIR|nr:VWA-like domain-containing protein [Treponema bryantii]SFI84815.1 Predicted metal-dependent peptidase [Treponema bryantii]